MLSSRDIVKESQNGTPHPSLLASKREGEITRQVGRFYAARVGVRVSLRRLLQFGMLCSGVLLPVLLPAQTNSPTTLPANRYLIIVETSRAMERRSTGTLRAVHDMIGSRMRGQLRLGDTIGVWTFNEKLYTGQLPLQDWGEGDRATIDDKILSFLGKQKYEKQGRFDAVLPALLQLVKNSQFITVILITEGNQDFHGTPFDQRINQSYKAWGAQQQDARMPFLTVLRARRGQFTDFSVTSAPWAIDMPPLPNELLKPKAFPSLPVVSAPKTAPPPTAPPLIISGKKSQPSPSVVTGTNTSTTSQALTPGIDSNPAPQLTQRTAEPQPTSAVGTAPTNVVPSIGTPSSGSIPPPAQSPALLETARNNQLANDNLKGQGPPPVAVEPHATETPPLAKQAGSPTTAVQGDTAAESRVAPRPELAVASETPIPTATKVIALILFGACCAAGLAFWLWRRRARPAGHVSLITRSFDRDRD